MLKRTRAFLARFFERLLAIGLALVDDVLLIAGCACVVYGLSLWSAVATWITAGLMLIGLAYLVGKDR